MNTFQAYIISFIIMLTLPKISLSQTVSDWKIAGTIPDANGMKTSLGLAGPVAGIHGRILIIGGGANFPEAMPWEGGKKTYYRELFIYEINNDSGFLLKRISRLPDDLAYPAVSSDAQGIVVCGGENEKGISSKCFRISWDEQEQDIQLQSLPDLPVGLINASAIICGSVVFVAGGEGKDIVSNALYALDLDRISEGWKKKAAIPHAVSHAVAIYSKESNSIYLIGGRRKNASGISDLYNEVFMYAVSTNQWTKKSSLPYTLSAGTGIDTGNGQLLVFGGDKGTVFHETEIVLKKITETSNKKIIGMLNKRKAALQSAHPGFSREILRYDVYRDKWTVESVFPFQTPVTTSALVTAGLVILPSGEIRAGVRTPEIITGKLNNRLSGTVR